MVCCSQDNKLNTYLSVSHGQTLCITESPDKGIGQGHIINTLFFYSFLSMVQETGKRAGGIWNCSGLGICKDKQYLHLVICKHQGGIRMLGGWERGDSVLGQQPPLHQHSRHDMWHIKTHIYSNGLIRGDKSQPQKYPYTTREDFILSRSRSRVHEVVLLKPRTCLNNFSITPETFEGTPHRAGNKGHDP